MKQDSDQARETWRSMIHVDSNMGNNNCKQVEAVHNSGLQFYPLSFNDFSNLQVGDGTILPI